MLFCRGTIGHGGETDVRTKLNNDFYLGKCPDPLGFLTANNIEAVLIWPDDKISDDLVAQLKKQLAPTYSMKTAGKTVRIMRDYSCVARCQ